MTSPFDRRSAEIRKSGFVLIAVLIVVSASLLVATGVLFIAQSRAADSAGTADSAQSRALAWSGVQIVVNELQLQRDALVGGDLPRLDRQYAVYETHNRAGVVRLLPMSASGDVLSAEAGKVDLNAVDAATLAKLGESLITPAAAQAIIDYRDQNLGRPFQSIGEIMNVPGNIITPQMLYGPIEEIKTQDQAQLVEGDLAQRVTDRLQTSLPRGLADVLTVFSVEPAVQKNGSPRINLNQPWSDALREQITARFDGNAAEQVKTAMETVKFQSDANVVQSLRQANLAPELWGELLDTFTTEAGEFHFSRLDINAASAEALQALPTVTPEQATQMVSVRQGLSEDDRNALMWPVVAQIITPENFEQVKGKITTRCFVYRVRIAAGEVDLEEPDGQMSNPIIFEAVIDLSSPTPRLAYMRDITLLQAAAQIAFVSSRNMPATIDRDEPAEEIATEDAATNEEAANLDEGMEAAPITDEGESALPDPSPAPVDQPANSRRKVGRWLGGGP